MQILKELNICFIFMKSSLRVFSKGLKLTTFSGPGEIFSVKSPHRNRLVHLKAIDKGFQVPNLFQCNVNSLKVISTLCKALPRCSRLLLVFFVYKLNSCVDCLLSKCNAPSNTTMHWTYDSLLCFVKYTFCYILTSQNFKFDTVTLYLAILLKV